MRLVIVGAGGHARVVIEAARASHREIAAVFDDDPARIGSHFMGIAVEGPVQSLPSRYPDAEVIVAIGDNRARMTIASSIPMPFATIVHPFSWVAPGTQVGAGTVVFAGSVIQPGSNIGLHCVLNTSCSVDHDCRLGSFSQIAPGARLAGAVSLGEGAYVGMNACVIQTLTVGAWSVVGAGAAVVRNVPDGTLVKGVPAR